MVKGDAPIITTSDDPGRHPTQPNPTYAQYNSNVILLDLYNRLSDEVQDNWSEFYDQKLLYLNKLKGDPIVNDLINFSVDF